MVKLTELNLIQFGKFSDYTINLKDGLNVIYGGNEAGKSTIQLFIKSMLYGIPSRGAKSRGIKDRDRVIPWSETRAVGRMKLNKDGKEIEIYREFRKRPSGDITRVILSSTGEDFFGREVKSDEVGLRLLGISLSMFERTVWIAQNDVGVQGHDDEITAKLINLMESGGYTDVSIGDALGRLESSIGSLKAKDRRSAPGVIDKLITERIRLLENRAETIAAAQKNEQIGNKIKLLTERIAVLDREKEHLSALELSEIAKEKAARVNQLDSCLTKEMQIANTRQFQLFRHKANEDTVKQIHEDSQTIDKTEIKAYQKQQELNENNKQILEKQSKQKRCIIAVGMAAAAAVASVAAGAVLKLPVPPIWIIVWLAIAILLVFCIVSYCNIRRNIVELKNKNTVLKCDIDLMREQIGEIEKRLSETLNILECDTVKTFDEKYGLYSEDRAKIKVVRDLYNQLLGNDSYEELKRDADEKKVYIIDEIVPKDFDIRRKINSIEVERDRNFSELSALKGSLKGEAVGSVSVMDIEDNINAVDDEIALREDELAAYKMARECLSEAYTGLKSDYTPLLNDKTEEFLQKITGGKHSSIKIAEDFTASLKNTDDRTDIKRAEFFSIGTYNQIYLALRLAVAELTLDTENTIVFLDDVLMTFDDERGKNTIEFLKNMCHNNNRQMLLFTCHSRDKNIAENYGEINIMEV